MQIRLSYSIIDAWLRGDFDRALGMLFYKPIEPTPAMLEGRKLHEQWETESRKTGKLPAVFGAAQLHNPKYERDTKREHKLNDWLTIAGRLDEFDDGIVGRDYKTGTTPSTTYANGKQHKIYKVLYPNMERFEYHCFNQYLPDGHPDQVTMSIVHLSDAMLEEGVELILTVGSDVRAYLENSGLEQPPLPTRK